MATAFSVTAIINFSKEAIELGSDLAEVQNVVDVTFGSMSSKVNQFAKDAMKSYGLSEKVAKQYMGTFGAMSKAFGYSTDAAYEQAAALTALTGDVASFYNLSTDEAYTKLKSVYTGETESLKDLGIVMTQTALDEFALQKGMGKTTKSMSEQEKVALRLAFVTERLSGASGDFQRTSDGWANQTRVLSLQFESLKAILGQGFINILTPLIKNLNEVIAKLIVVAQKFRDFTQLIFGDAGSTTSAVTAVADSAGEISSNIDSATSSAKELKKQLAGFDKLNVLGSDSDSNSDMSSTITDVIPTEGTGTDETVLSMTIEEAEELKKKLDDILGIVMAISIGLLTWKLTHSVGITLAVTGVALFADSVKKALEDGLDEINFAEMIGGGGLTIGGLAILGEKLGSALLGGGIGAILVGIPMAAVGIYDAIKNELNALNATLIPLGTSLAGAGLGATAAFLSAKLGATIGTAISPGLGTVIGLVIGLIIGLLIDLGILIYQKWEEIMSWLKINVVQPLATFFEPLISAATEAWSFLDEKIFTPISEAVGYVVGYAYEKFSEIKDGLVGAFLVIWSKVSEIVAKIKEIFVALAWAFNEYVWKPIRQKVIDFYNEYLAPIVEKIRSAVQTIKNFLLGIKNWLKEKIIDKILAWVDILVDKIKGVGTKVVDFLGNTFKSVINGVLGAIESAINNFIRLLNGAIGVINKIPGVNITTVGEIQIPRLAKGAVIPANKEFLAVLGDQKNGRNLELPESLLRQIVREESGNGKNNGGTFIIQLVLKGKVIGEEAVEYVNGVIRKTGKSPIKQGG